MKYIVEYSVYSSKNSFGIKFAYWYGIVLKKKHIFFQLIHTLNYEFDFIGSFKQYLEPISRLFSLDLAISADHTVECSMWLHFESDSQIHHNSEDIVNVGNIAH